MRFEHFALNVVDARSMAAWYVEHLGLSVVRQRPDSPYTHFLADSSGHVLLELYSNPAAPVPAYAQQHPLVFHVAFVSTHAELDRARLEAAGATWVADDRLPDGSTLTMLRDPWGVALQLCQRAVPF